MKVLHINCVYPVGSTGKITAAIHRNLLRKGRKSVVLYGRGVRCADLDAKKMCGEFSAKVNHAFARISGMMYGGCYPQTVRILRTIEREKPDVVHLQCINGYFVNIYRLISWLKEHQVPTVLTLHAEFMYTANCGCAFDCDGWKTGCGNCPNPREAVESLVFDRTGASFERMRKAFDGFGDRLRVVGVSDWLCGRAAESPIFKNISIQRIYNGIDISVFCPQDAGEIRQELGIKPDEKLVLWVTSGFTHAKGKDLFFALADRMGKYPYRFVVVGADRPAGDERNVIYLGQISDQQRLAGIYSAADVTICCSRQESYPTTMLESQCCGTPVVGFEVGGVAETIYPGMGETIPLGDIDRMADAVERWCRGKEKLSAQVLDSCIRDNSDQTMADAYLPLYENTIMEQKK